MKISLLFTSSSLFSSFFFSSAFSGLVSDVSASSPLSSVLPSAMSTDGLVSPFSLSSSDVPWLNDDSSSSSSASGNLLESAFVVVVVCSVVSSCSKINCCLIFSITVTRDKINDAQVRLCKMCIAYCVISNSRQSHSPNRWNIVYSFQTTR